MSEQIRSIGSRLKSVVRQKQDEYAEHGLAVDLDIKQAMKQEETDDLVRVLANPNLSGNFKIEYIIAKIMQTADKYYRSGSDRKFAKLRMFVTMAEIEWKRIYNANMSMAKHSEIICKVNYGKKKVVEENQAGNIVEKEVDDERETALTPLDFCEMLRQGKINLSTAKGITDEIMKIKTVEPQLDRGEKPALSSQEIMRQLNDRAEDDYLPFLKLAWSYHHQDKDISPYKVTVLHLSDKKGEYEGRPFDTSKLEGREKPSGENLPRTSKA